MILDTLRKQFTKALYGWVPALNRAAAREKAQVDELVRQINEIRGFYTMPLARNFQTLPDYTSQYDWMCLLADRVGEPVGVRTAFRLRWGYGHATQRPGCLPYSHPSYTDLNIVLPLEKIFSVMVQLQNEKRREFALGPCTMTFERTMMEDARQLVAEYRALRPVKKDFLTLVKK